MQHDADSNHKVTAHQSPSEATIKNSSPSCSSISLTSGVHTTGSFVNLMPSAKSCVHCSVLQNDTKALSPKRRLKYDDAAASVIGCAKQLTVAAQG